MNLSEHLYVDKFIVVYEGKYKIPFYDNNNPNDQPNNKFFATYLSN
jgi:hypothetical protein